MASTHNMELLIYNKDRQFQGMSTEILGIDFTLRMREVSGGTITIAGDSSYLKAALADGARYSLRHNGIQISSGYIDKKGVSSSGDYGNAPIATLVLVDDYILARQVLAWPDYTQSITAQRYEHWNYSGSLESAIRAAFTNNSVTRLGMAVVQSDVGSRGGTIFAKGRFDTIEDLFSAELIRQNLGLRIYCPESPMNYASLKVEVYSPRVRTGVLSIEGGHIESYSYEQSNPTATRAVVGGAEEGKARIFETVVDSAAEAKYGFVREIFIDARDLGGDYRDALNDRDNKLEARNDAWTEYVDAKNERASALRTRDRAYDIWQNSLEHSNTTKQTTAKDNYDDAVVAYTTANNNNNNKAAAYNTAVTNYNTAVTEVATQLAAHRAELQARGLERLAEQAATTGIAVILSETENYSYGPNGFLLGDTVTIQAGDLQLTETLSSVTFKWDVENGLTVRPEVGSYSATPEKRIARAISKAFASLRKLRAR